MDEFLFLFGIASFCSCMLKIDHENIFSSNGNNQN